MLRSHVIASAELHPTAPPPAAGPTVALIPAFNEERYIGSVVLSAYAHVDLVVVVDDGSADNTAAIARQAGAVVVRQPANAGKAAAVSAGFAYLCSIRPAAVVMLDGDCQHSARDIPQVLAPILSGDADIVIGSRFLDIHSDIPAYRLVGQHSLTWATNLASGYAVTDSQSGYRAFSAEALRELTFSQGGFSVESEMQFRAAEMQFRVAEVPIHVSYAAPAKRNPVRHGLQVLRGLAGLMSATRPLIFFGLSGSTLFVLGLALGLIVIQIQSVTHELATGYALLTVLLCLMGVSMVVCGVVLQTTKSILNDFKRTLVDRISRG